MSAVTRDQVQAGRRVEPSTTPRGTLVECAVTPSAPTMV
jgi:hypothetical protein